MLGLKAGVETRAWGRGIDGRVGALAQAEAISKRALHIRKRMATFYQSSVGGVDETDV